MASCPAPVACVEKYRLLKKFAAAVSDYHRMQSFQLAGLLKGDEFSFEEEIRKAAERRDAAKYAVLAHQDEHGC
jgi:hypothetical protein